MAVDDMTEPARLAALMEAEERAFALFDAIEAANLVAPGRTERAVEQDIRALAFDDFGVSKHWHKRVVRAGINTITTAGDNPPDRVIGEDDIVYLDLRSEEHTSELQSLMRISYAVFCLKKKKPNNPIHQYILKIYHSQHTVHTT